MWGTLKYKVRESKIFRLRKESLEEGIITVPLMGWNPENGSDIKLRKAAFNQRNEIYQWKELSLKIVHAFQQK